MKLIPSAIALATDSEKSRFWYRQLDVPWMPSAFVQEQGLGTNGRKRQQQQQRFAAALPMVAGAPRSGQEGRPRCAKPGGSAAGAIAPCPKSVGEMVHKTAV